MNFAAAYQIIGRVPDSLLEKVNEEINHALTDADFNYKDRNVETAELSWLRLDFMRPPEDKNRMPLYNSILAVINHITENYNIDPLNSVSVSMLKPLQVLDEHTDGRFLHRITNRYLVPLMDSEVNYNYGWYENEKVIYPLRYGNIYRVNNAIVHSALNLENAERFNILIDTWEPRLKAKFKDHQDLMAALTVLGVNYNFEKRLKVKPK
jgi:hypothetical protein